MKRSLLVAAFVALATTGSPAQTASPYIPEIRRYSKR
jgi:hypothetical protein